MWRERLDRTLKQLTIAAMAIAAAAIALCFFSLAAFVFMSERYNAIVASVVLGGVYLVLALAALVWLRLVRSKEEASGAAAVGAAQLWQNPIVVSTGLEVLRALGPRKVAPLAAVALAGVVLAASRTNPKSKPSRSGSKTGS